MRLSELTQPPTQLSAIPTYINERLNPPPLNPNEKPKALTKDQQEGLKTVKVIGGIFRLIGLVLTLLVLSMFGYNLGGFIIAAVWLAVVILPKQTLTILTGLNVWLITHLGGIGVYATLSIGFLFLWFLDPKTYSLLFLMIWFVAHFALAIVGTGISYLNYFVLHKAPAAEEPEAEVSDGVAFVTRELPLALMDYLAPAAAFPRDSVLVSNFPNPEDYKQELANAEARRKEERYEFAKTFVQSVEIDPEDESAVLARVLVKDNREGLTKLTSIIDGRLNAYGTAALPQGDSEGGGSVVFRIYVVPADTPLSILTREPVDAEKFFAENPATSHDDTPIGVGVNGDAFGLDTHHTIVAGRTGSGKGSVLQCLVLQWLPFVAAGTRRLWLADPKPAESLPYFDNVREQLTTSVFHRVAVEDEDIADLIFEFHAEMIKQKKNPNVGRSNAETKENPGNYLIIDELASFIDSPMWSKKNSDGITVGEAVRAVTRKGRSLNFFLYVFTQSLVGKDVYELSRNIPIKLTGYLGLNSLETTRGLDISEGELQELTALREVIFPLFKSTKKNGHRYSGIFNYKEETNAAPLRTPYISEEFIAQRVAQFGLDKPPSSPEERDDEPTADDILAKF